MNKPEPDPRRRAYGEWQRRERAGDLRAALGLLLLAWLVFLAVPAQAQPAVAPGAGASTNAVWTAQRLGLPPVAAPLCRDAARALA